MLSSKQLLVFHKRFHLF